MISQSALKKKLDNDPESPPEEQDDDDKSILSDTSAESVPSSSKDGGNKLVGNLAKRETRAVALLRATLVLVLILCAAALSLVVYRYTSNEETSEFEKDFQAHGAKLIDAAERNLERQLSALNNFGTTLTSYASDTNASWPFVTLPDFERRAHRTAAEVNAIGLLLAVKVNSDQREQWDKYSVDNIDWAFEGVAYQHTGAYGGQSDINMLFPPVEETPATPPGPDMSNGSGTPDIDTVDTILPSPGVDISTSLKSRARLDSLF